MKIVELSKNSQLTIYPPYSILTMMNSTMYQPKFHSTLQAIFAILAILASLAILAILAILHAILSIMAMKMTCLIMVMAMATTTVMTTTPKIQ